MFDYHLIEQVITLWNREEGSEGGSPLRFSHVKVIMETVFLAGLKREEDRPVQVSVCLADPDMFPLEARVAEQVVMRLDRRLSFTVDALVKVAPAFDPVTTAVAVWTAPRDPSVLEVWGSIFSTRRGHNRFDPLPFTAFTRTMLTVSAVKPGSLSISRGSHIFARFQVGQFLEPTSTPFTSSLMGWSLLRVVKRHHGFRRYGTKYWRTYRDVIDRMLVEAGKLAHGGTIIWLPEEILGDAEAWILAKYVVEHGPEGTSLPEHLCDLDLQRISRLERAARHTDEQVHCGAVAQARAMEEGILECKRHIVEHAELLSCLTRVDGALIITDHLRPLSFGSVLIAPVWQGEVVYGPEEKTPTSIPVALARYGTRHHSAVNFVGQCPGAVAFVISQDGPVAGITRKDENTIYWWPDCLSTLWVF